MTHTYALLDLSQAAYDEIASRLKIAGYDHAFVDIDMHGIAVVPKPATPTTAFRIAYRKHEGGPWVWLGTVEFASRELADMMRYEFSMQDTTRLYYVVERGPNGDPPF